MKGNRSKGSSCCPLESGPGCPSTSLRSTQAALPASGRADFEEGVVGLLGLTVVCISFCFFRGKQDGIKEICPQNENAFTFSSTLLRSRLSRQ